MKEVLEVNFELISVKSLKDGTSMKCSFKEKDTGNIVEVSNMKDRPHPDFTKPFKELKEYFADMFGVISKDKVTVTGVTISGDNEKEGIVMTGKILCANEGYVGVATPRIFIANDILGYEADIVNHVNTIRAEVYNYLFKNKRAQLSMFEGEEKEKESEIKNK